MSEDLLRCGHYGRTCPVQCDSLDRVREPAGRVRAFLDSWQESHSGEAIYDSGDVEPALYVADLRALLDPRRVQPPWRELPPLPGEPYTCRECAALTDDPEAHVAWHAEIAPVREAS